MSTGIQWTSKTWNPVTGCTRVSAGCDNCYAFRLHDQRYAAQLRTARTEGYSQIADARDAESPALPAILPFRAGQYDWPFSVVQLLPDRLEEPLHWRKPRHVFVDSMGDLFHEDVPDDYIDRVFAVMALTPQHTYQVLTKRDLRLAPYFDSSASGAKREQLVYEEAARRAGHHSLRWPGWPLPNVWLGVSIEDQDAADERIPHLLQTPAAVRFLSCEPLIGPVDLGQSIMHRRMLCSRGMPIDCPCLACERKRDGLPRELPRIDWVIVGGESGSRARPCDLEWIRDIVRQCQAARVPVFVKQLGSRPIQTGGDCSGCTDPASEGTHQMGTVQHGPDHVYLKRNHGGDPEEWPEDLRVREMPS